MALPVLPHYSLASAWQWGLRSPQSLLSNGLGVCDVTTATALTARQPALQNTPLPLFLLAVGWGVLVKTLNSTSEQLVRDYRYRTVRYLRRTQCEHGRRKNRCKECGGSGVCEA